MRPDPVPAARRQRARIVGVLLRVSLALLVMVMALAIHPSAYAADTAVDVKLTTSEITGTGANAVLHLAGTVTNTGTATLYTVQVLTWRDTTPITSRTQLATALA